ncbi:palmitoyl-acyl carrier protein thioesterase, chloroplastic-like [Henckelia pumila]|uniref:palmitoyl-acyl carrier protein thioesterase, chloroplastic-like n=1 Tax=Henckelia pumila TaxID=405737 RepID=UPI003C6E4425
MVANAATSAFLPLVSPTSDSSGKPLGKFVGSTDGRGNGLSSKSSSLGNLRVRANRRIPPKVSGAKVGFTDGFETDEVTPSPPPRMFVNQFPDWNMLLAAITTLFLAAEKQWMMLDWKPKRADMLFDPYGFGKIVPDGSIYRQNFSIMSYETGADQTASVETLMNHFQETALNHTKSVGLLDDGFGSTPGMSKNNLIWVVTKMQLLVDRYPVWGDVVQVTTWVVASGKNGIRRDWLVRDTNTGDILTRASSLMAMMNKETRKLAKIPEEAREEMACYFVDYPSVVDEDSRKLPKLNENTADSIRTGLTPRWNDLDVNQHVNNVKYVDWILESTPSKVLETRELFGMTLEYRRECRKDSVLESLTSVVENKVGDLANSGYIECQHLLRLENGGEIVKGRTDWRPKSYKAISSDPLPAESAQ